MPPLTACLQCNPYAKGELADKSIFRCNPTDFQEIERTFFESREAGARLVSSSDQWIAKTLTAGKFEACFIREAGTIPPGSFGPVESTIRLKDHLVRIEAIELCAASDADADGEGQFSLRDHKRMLFEFEAEVFGCRVGAGSVRSRQEHREFFAAVPRDEVGDPQAAS